MRRTRNLPIAGGLAALVAVGGSALALASGGRSGTAAEHPARAQLISDLAARLGKPADQVKAALKAVRPHLTQAQRADRLRRRAQRLQQRASDLAEGVRPGRAGRGRGAGRAWAAALAEQLHVTTAKVDSALRAVAAKRIEQGRVPPALLHRLAMIRA
jgi:hypothetical protein